jgi:hypothetical protein
MFTHALTKPSSLRGEYLTALQGHTGCDFCLRVHAEMGSKFCDELESKLALSLDKVHRSFFNASTVQ